MCRDCTYYNKILNFLHNNESVIDLDENRIKMLFMSDLCNTVKDGEKWLFCLQEFLDTYVATFVKRNTRDKQ